MDSLMKAICLLVYIIALSATANTIPRVTVDSLRLEEVTALPTQAPTNLPTQAPTTTRVPTAAATTQQVTTSSIKKEGLAAYAMADAIPQLKTLKSKFLLE